MAMTTIGNETRRLNDDTPTDSTLSGYRFLRQGGGGTLDLWYVHNEVILCRPKAIEPPFDNRRADD